VLGDNKLNLLVPEGLNGGIPIVPASGQARRIRPWLLFDNWERPYRTLFGVQARAQLRSL
jgi:hypothetical protein